MKKPIKVMVSPLTDRIYAFRSYKEINSTTIEVTGSKDDVTDDVRRIIDEQLRRWIESEVVIVKNPGALNAFFGHCDGQEGKT